MTNYTALGNLIHSIFNTYSATPWSEVAFQTAGYIITSSEDTYINREGVDGRKCLFFAKKFPLDLFFDIKNIDSLLIELNKQIKQEAGLNLFMY